MREFSVPASVRVGDDDTLSDTVFALADEHPDAVALRRRVDDAWAEVTCAAFVAEIVAVARGLIAAGIAPGDRVALLSRTRYEWTLFDYAIWPPAPSPCRSTRPRSAEQVAWILADSGRDRRGRRGRAARRDGRPGVENPPEHVWRIDPTPRLAGRGRRRSPRAGAAVPASRGARTPPGGSRADDLATLIYTSGTTGRPKGCELTHRNLVAEVRTVIDGAARAARRRGLAPAVPAARARLRQGDRSARPSTAGRCWATPRTPSTCSTTSRRSGRPCSWPCPRVFEKVYNGARRKAVDDGKGKIFDAAAATAIAWSEACDTGGPGVGLKLRHALFDRLVYRQAAGGARRAGAGGGVRQRPARRAPRPLLPRRRRPGAGGLRPHRDLRRRSRSTPLRRAADRHGRAADARPRPSASPTTARSWSAARSCSRGYWNNAEATAEAFDRRLVPHRRHRRARRRRASSASPAARRRSSSRPAARTSLPRCSRTGCGRTRWSASVLVVGDGQPFIAALVTIDPEALPRWRRAARQARGRQVGGRPRRRP